MPADEMKTIALQGIELPYLRTGTGPPLVMLHGGGGPEFELPFTRRLAERFDIIAPVHPGFAGTPIPDQFDCLEDLVFLYLDLLDALDLQDATLMGFSMGGWVAAELACMNNSRLARLILVDPVGVKVGGREDRDIADVFALPPDKLAALAFHDPSLAPAPTDITDKELQIIAANQIALGVYTWEPYMHNPKLPGRLHRIKIPTHFIWGRSDGIVTLDYGRKFQAMIAAATLTVIDNAGHAPQVEQPDAFVSTVLDLGMSEESRA